MSYLFLDLPRSVSIDCLIELKLAHEPKMICLNTNSCRSNYRSTSILSEEIADIVRICEVEKQHEITSKKW